MNLKYVVGHFRTEQRALDDRRNPIAVEPRLAIRIYDKNFRSGFLRVVQIFRGDRLIVGEIRSDQHDQIAADPI